MGLQVIGAGVGRTGTHSLKLAINQLGLGPCHHMEEVVRNMDRQLPLWSEALTAGKANWEAIYDGYGSAVDWPTARYFRELHAHYPTAKFVLTHRTPETWAESFAATIYKLISAPDAPAAMRDWLQWCSVVISQSGFPPGLDTAGLKRAFVAHNQAVEAAIPASQLLVYQVSEGWAPLCTFLGVAAPDEPFPRTNNRHEFWDLVAQAAPS